MKNSATSSLSLILPVLNGKYLPSDLNTVVLLRKAGRVPFKTSPSSAKTSAWRNTKIRFRLTLEVNTFIFFRRHVPRTNRQEVEFVLKCLKLSAYSIMSIGESDYYRYYCCDSKQDNKVMIKNILHVF